MYWLAVAGGLGGFVDGGLRRDVDNCEWSTKVRGFYRYVAGLLAGLWWAVKEDCCGAVDEGCVEERVY
jgi:hypothetical protein